MANETGTNFTEEFPEAAELAPETEVAEGVSTDLPTVPAKKEKETYELADGSIGSRAAFIREKFLNDNMSRKEVAEAFGLTKKEIKNLLRYFKNGRYMFTNWKKLNVTKELNAKISQEVYA